MRLTIKSVIALAMSCLVSMACAEAGADASKGDKSTILVNYLTEHGVIIKSVTHVMKVKCTEVVVDFPYDPLGNTSSYFDPLYVHAVISNSNVPISFVDHDEIRVNIGWLDSKHHKLEVNYDDVGSIPCVTDPKKRQRATIIKYEARKD